MDTEAAIIRAAIATVGAVVATVEADIATVGADIATVKATVEGCQQTCHRFLFLYHKSTCLVQPIIQQYRVLLYLFKHILQFSQRMVLPSKLYQLPIQSYQTSNPTNCRPSIRFQVNQD